LEFKIFDVVYILSTKGIVWLSGPQGNPAKPDGYWYIVAIRGDGKIVLSKDETIIVTDIMNIRKVGSYDLDKVFKKIENVTKELIKGERNGSGEGKVKE